jgi:hypothetical protein
MEIALEKIDILIDLNGGTLNSGGSLHACINLCKATNNLH